MTTVHGDTVTTITIAATQAETIAATGCDGWADYTEYGAPRAGSTTATVAGPVGYGWLGGKQRSTTTESAGLTLMGDRFYNPTRGAFTSLDPEPGGNDTAYNYPNDPINGFDLDGNRFTSVDSVGGGAAIGAALAGSYVVYRYRYSAHHSQSNYQRGYGYGRSSTAFVAAAVGASIVYMGHRGKSKSRNSDREGHRGTAKGKTAGKKKHSEAQSHGGRQKPNFQTYKNYRKPKDAEK